MPFLLRDLPFEELPSEAFVGLERVAIKPYQFLVWVSVSAHDVLALPPDARRLPALLDPGNNHNFSIQEGHLQRWAELALQDLKPLRSIAERGRRVRCYAASVWLHPNQPGTRQVRAGAAPARLVLAEGIPVFPPPAGDELPYPRLPLLGLRALTDNKLDTNIQGSKRLVSVRSPGR